MLTANSAAILTDAFPAEQRGFALGTNQVAGWPGCSSAWCRRHPRRHGLAAGVLGQRPGRDLRHRLGVPHASGRTSQRQPSRIDWWGNVSFAVGLSAILVASTYGIQPYGGHTMGWTSPWVIAGLVGGAALLGAFVAIERRVKARWSTSTCSRSARSPPATSPASRCRSRAGGLQFMLVIWLQGIWLPLHGYSFSQTPLWAGIYMLPLTVGFLIAGPISGTLSDRIGSRGLATAGAAISGLGFIGLMVLPVDFPYAVFALLLALIGAASGMFASPNSSSIMGSVPAVRTWRRIGHARDVPELGHRDLDRHLLHAGDRRRREQPAGDAQRWPDPRRRADRDRPSARRVAAGVEPVRRAPRDQPARAPAEQSGRASLPVRGRPPDVDRPRLLPPPDLKSVPRRPRRRVRDLGRAVGRRSVRVAATWRSHHPAKHTEGAPEWAPKPPPGSIPPRPPC